MKITTIVTTSALGRYPAGVAFLSAAGLLAACGGGGTGIAPIEPKPEGAYAGTLTGSASTAFQLLVLENDEYWALYGRNVGNSFLVAGFIQGTGIANNGSFSSTNARDFGVVPAASGTVSASYVAGTSIQGTVSSGGGTVTLAGTAFATSTFDYNAAASLATIAGNWNLTALDGSATALAIAANGSFTGSSAGCSFSGTLAPRPSGKIVFNFSVTFGAAPCVLPGQSASGIAISSLLAGTTTRQLIAAGVNGARTTGTALFGTR
jgi:hypothetical protein